MIDDIKPQTRDKFVRFTPEVHANIAQDALALSKERGGGSISVPAYLAEAAQYFKEKRNKS